MWPPCTLYFPSKRDLLSESVLGRAGLHAGPGQPTRGVQSSSWADRTLAQLVADLTIISMIKVEDFVRLMIGEAIRGDSTARSVGYDLFTTFEQLHPPTGSRTQRPDLTERSKARPEIAPAALCAMMVGLFVQYAAGVLLGAVGSRTSALRWRWGGRRSRRRCIESGALPKRADPPPP